MRKSVEDAVRDKGQKRSETIEWINTASIRELRDFMYSSGNLDPWFSRAQNALWIQLTERQLEAAKILERYTVQLVSFTRALVWLTVGILILTVFLAIRH